MGNIKGESGGGDIIVNKTIKFEVKGTSTKRDITTKSKSNADVFALVWVETEDWMNGISDEINVRVLYNPHGINVEHLKSNGEDKIRLHESFEEMKQNGLTEEIRFDLNKFMINKHKNPWFNTDDSEKVEVKVA